MDGPELIDDFYGTIFWNVELINGDEYWSYWRTTIELISGESFELLIHADSESDSVSIRNSYPVFTNLIEKISLFQIQLVENLLHETPLFFDKEFKEKIPRDLAEKNLQVNRIEIFQDMSSTIEFVAKQSEPCSQGYYCLIDSQSKLIGVGILAEQQNN